MSLLKQLEAYDRAQQRRIEYLEAEVKHWQDKYTALLNDTVRYGDAMFNAIVKEMIDRPSGKP